MATKTIDHALTVRDFFFGGTDAGISVLQLRMEKNGAFHEVGAALAQLSRPTLKELHGELAATLAGLLEMDLGEIILRGLRKHHHLKAAARRTLAVPNSTETVPLDNPHVLTSVHYPVAEVLIDGGPPQGLRFELKFELTVKLTVQRLVASVRHGKLVNLRGGQCEAKATLKWRSVELAERAAQLDLPLVVRLGEGRPLLTRKERERLEEELHQERPAH